MFDSRALTPEIKSYLSNESDFLARVMSTGYASLVEVGCGYGRYLEWSLSRGYNYIGIDIVPWLVELGQLRVAAAKKKYASADCKVLLHPAEEISSVIEEIAMRLPERNALILFPFNCLGNVSRFEAVLDSIQESGVAVVVSTFKTDATSTKIRKEYYRNCGFEQLNSRILRQGLLMVSAEGFHAMAYHGDWLANAFRRRSFELKERYLDSSVGSIYYFKPEEEPGAGVVDTGSSSTEAPLMRVILSCITDDPLAQVAGAESSAQLLTFGEISADLQLVSPERLQGTCSEYLEPNQLLHFALPVVPGKTDTEWFVDLAARVVSCEAITEGYKLVLALSKPARGVMERLVVS